MDFKLNVYDEAGEVVKTYQKADVRISTGVCEDVLKYLDFEKLMKVDTENEKEVLSMAGGLLKMRSQYETIVRRIFPSMSEEEYRNTDMEEVSAMIWSIVQFSFGQMMGITEGKNRKG